MSEGQHADVEGSQPDPRKPGERPLAVRMREAKSWALLVFVIVSFAFGAIAQVAAMDLNVASSVWGLLFNVTVLIWLDLDAHERGARLTTWRRIGVVLLSFVFVPWVLLRTRGWRAVVPLVVGVLYAAFTSFAFTLGAVADA